MARQMKAWGDHSPKWQKQQEKAGLNPKLWDRWRRLSPKTRANSNPVDYAKGISIPQQRYAVALNKAVDRQFAFAAAKAQQVGKRPIDRRTVLARFRRLSGADINKLNRKSQRAYESYVTSQINSAIADKTFTLFYYH